MATSTDEMLEVRREEVESGVIVLRARGDLLIMSARKLWDEVDNCIEREEVKIIISLFNVDYADAFGIGVIVKVKSAIEKRGGKFAVILNHNLFELFEKCHLDEYIKLYKCEENGDLEEKEKEVIDWVLNVVR